MGFVWKHERYDAKGYPEEMTSKFAQRYSVTLGHGVAREVTSMATAMMAWPVWAVGRG